MSSSSKCKLSITGSALWNACCTPSQNSWLLAAFPVSSLERDATFPSWEKPSPNQSENRMLCSLKGHWVSFLVSVDSSTSEVLPCLVLTWCVNASFLIICSFAAFLIPQILSWLQTACRSLYLNDLTSWSQTVNSSPTVPKSAQVTLSNCLLPPSCLVQLTCWLLQSFVEDLITGKCKKHSHMLFCMRMCFFLIQLEKYD